MSKKKNNKPVIGFFDIETSPIITYSWGLYNQDLSLPQMVEDWYVLSYCFKYKDNNKLYYKDQRNVKDLSNDKSLLEQLAKLIDTCDILVGQNIDNFDLKKIRARMIQHNLPPLKKVKTVDTLKEARRSFSFTSNKLAYLSDILCAKFKKSEHKKFPGLDLWKECLKRNKSAFKELEHYNKLDVLSLEETYNKLAPWMKNHPDFNLYTDSEDWLCRCGSKDFVRNGHAYTSSGKYQRFIRKKCGAESKGRTNELTKEKKASLRK